MARYDGQAQWLAGGQSLLAMMNLRLANPPALIDIRGIAGLSDIRQSQGVVRIGALCTHNQLLNSALIQEAVPLLAQAVPFGPPPTGLAIPTGELPHGSGPARRAT